MVAAAAKPPEAVRDRDHWLSVVEQLAHQVESWARGRGWAVQRDNKLIQESRLGEYRVPVVSILAPAGRIQLDPVARFVGVSGGRVDLIAWPSLSRMLLVRDGNRWKLKTDSGVDWPQKWSQRTFVHLVEVLNTAN